MRAASSSRTRRRACAGNAGPSFLSPERPVADRSNDPRHELGILGELAAERALEAAGLRVVARRARFRGGEVDLVALEEDLVVFVEVKTRSGLAHGRPADAVNFRKRARMARAALAYLVRRDWLARPCRFDVVEVVRDPATGKPQVIHIRDAFRLGLRG